MNGAWLSRIHEEQVLHTNGNFVVLRTWASPRWQNSDGMYGVHSETRHEAKQRTQTVRTSIRLKRDHGLLGIYRAKRMDQTPTFMKNQDLNAFQLFERYCSAPERLRFENVALSYAERRPTERYVDTNGIPLSANVSRSQKYIRILMLGNNPPSIPVEERTLWQGRNESLHMLACTVDTYKNLFPAGYALVTSSGDSGSNLSWEDFSGSSAIRQGSKSFLGESPGKHIIPRRIAREARHSSANRQGSTSFLGESPGKHVIPRRFAREASHSSVNRQGSTSFLGESPGKLSFLGDSPGKLDPPYLPHLTLPHLPHLTLPFLTYLTLPHLPHLTLPFLTYLTLPHLPHLTLPYLTSAYLTSLTSPRLTLPHLPHLTSLTSPHLTSLTSPHLTLPHLPHLTLFLLSTSPQTSY